MANGDYAEMIELPVSTCEMVVVQKKKRNIFKGKFFQRKKKQPDQEVGQVPTIVEVAGDAPPQTQTIDTPPVIEAAQKPKKEPMAKRFKFSLVGAEVAAIFILVVAILLTNIFWENSGINVLIRSVFGTNQTTDQRVYGDFTVFAPSKATSMSVEEGVITVNGKAAVYAPADGVVESVVERDGVFTLTIRHSESFTSVVAGADAAYVSEGETVYANIPVAHTAGGATVTMYDNGSLITTFMLDGVNIVWQS